MASLNKVMLIGNLTQDPEVRYTPKGTAVTDLRLAVNRYISREGAERQEETTFVDVTLWGRTAEIAGQYLAKGRSVFIEGRLQLDQWQDRESGQNRSKLKVVGEGMQFLGGKGDGPASGGSNQRADYGSAPASPPPPSGGGGSVEEDDDDIPF